jgi:AraC family transcriptional regulator
MAMKGGAVMKPAAPKDCISSAPFVPCAPGPQGPNAWFAVRWYSAMERGCKDPSEDDGTLRPPGCIGEVAFHPTVEIRPPDLVRRRVITCHGMTAETVQSASHTRLEYRFRAPMHLLVIYEDGARRDGETFVEGLSRSTLRRFARKLTLVPAGYQYYECHDLHALSRLTYFYFDPAKLRVYSETGSAGLSFAPRLFFEDGWLWHTALKLIDLVEHPVSGDQLYFEALGVVIVYQLLRLHRGGPGGQPQVRGGLGPWQQRIATAYIEEHLTERIELATLARLARRTPFHFCRAFKQSFGMPPLRYQTRRRIEHAKLLLLAKPAMSVTDIGLTIGFGCSTSFATAFRKATGVTPTAYQRSFG